MVATPARARAPSPSKALGEGPGLDESPRPVLGAPRGIIGWVVVVTEVLCLDAVVVFVATPFLLGAVVVVFVAVGAVVVFVAVVAVVVFVAAVVVVVDPAEETKQVGTVMVLASSVTAPLRASTRPRRVAPVSRVAEVSARIVPAKLLDVPSVAELPTCQNTLQAWAPFSSTTVLPDAVTNVEPA